MMRRNTPYSTGMGHPQVGIPVLILVHGATATGKSTTATILGARLGIPIVAGHHFGPVTSRGCVDGSRRAWRYQQRIAEADRLLRQGSSVIVDGVFERADDRESMYQLAETFSARLLVVRTRCSDLVEVQRRLDYRRDDPTGPDHDIFDIQHTALHGHAGRA